MLEEFQTKFNIYNPLKSFHTPWTFPYFVTLQPQAWKYFTGILCDKQTQRNM